MSSRFEKKDIPKLKDRIIFFDANVLIYLYCPMGGVAHKKIQKYSSIFNDLIKQNNKLSVNETVLSEFINRSLKFEFEKTRLPKADYKKFRNSKNGISTQNNIFQIVKNKILRQFEVTSKEFSKDDIENMLTVDTYDFNDKLIIDVCKEYNRHVRKPYCKE